MSHRRIVASAVFVAMALLAGGARGAQAQGFPSSSDAVPADWTGPVFVLSQDYPDTLPAAEPKPWKTVDFRTSPVTYARSVLRYALQGNVAVDWQGQDNAVRTWYHAPWMHGGASGREFVHGLTRERDSRPGELHPDQTSTFQNWAVSLYNAPGGFVIGQVWADPDAPDASQAAFPDGTVSIKLLFTMATPDQVPTLLGAPEWEAFVGAPRQIRTVRLLQVDLAVRDDRADDTTGWVFGTFVYDPDARGTAGMRPWDKLTPVGIMWGNDPDRLGTGEPLQESRINRRAAHLVTHLGWEGRLNGPVDNPDSSCLSCHGTAQDPQGAMIPRTTSQTSLQRFFRNVPAGTPFDAGRVSTDYSLQLAFGIRNQRRAVGLEAEPEGEEEPPREGLVDEAEYEDDAEAAPERVAPGDDLEAMVAEPDVAVAGVGGDEPEASDESAASDATADDGPAASGDAASAGTTPGIGGDAAGDAVGPGSGAVPAAGEATDDDAMPGLVAAAWLIAVVALTGAWFWMRAARHEAASRAARDDADTP